MEGIQVFSVHYNYEAIDTSKAVTKTLVGTFTDTEKPNMSAIDNANKYLDRIRIVNGIRIAPDGKVYPYFECYKVDVLYK